MSIRYFSKLSNDDKTLMLQYFIDSEQYTNKYDRDFMAYLANNEFIMNNLIIFTEDSADEKESILDSYITYVGPRDNNIFSFKFHHKDLDDVTLNSMPKIDAFNEIKNHSRHIMLNIPITAVNNVLKENMVIKELGELDMLNYEEHIANTKIFTCQELVELCESYMKEDVYISEDPALLYTICNNDSYVYNSKDNLITKVLVDPNKSYELVSDVIPHGSDYEGNSYYKVIEIKE